jgi:hypothetical protein
MTGRELLDRMLVLGGRTDWQDSQQESAAISAANQAIGEVNVLFPLTKTVRLLHYPLRPVVYHKGIVVHRGGEDMEFDASGVKSLAFAVSGTGSAILTADDVGDSYTFEWQDSSSFTLCRGIVEELIGSSGRGVHLRFTGEFNYMIKDLSFYSELVSPLCEDVDVYSPYVRYDLASDKYAGHKFLAFESLPVRYDNVDLNLPRDYKIDGTSIYIRTDLRGVYEIAYRVRPERIDPDNDELEIELDPELYNMVAPRAAYYLYYMTDEEVADRCNVEYQRLYAQYIRIHKVKTPPQFRDVRGW